MSQQEYIEMMERKVAEHRQAIGMREVNFKETIRYKIEELIIKDPGKTREALMELAEEIAVF